MLEFDGLGVGRHFEHRLHVTERGAKDQRVALIDQIANHALGVRTFRHVLDEAGLYLAGESGLCLFARLVVGERPARVAHWADVRERDLERTGLFFRLCRRGGRRGGSGGRGLGCRLLFATPN